MDIIYVYGLGKKQEKIIPHLRELKNIEFIMAEDGNAIQQNIVNNQNSYPDNLIIIGSEGLKTIRIQQAKNEDLRLRVEKLEAVLDAIMEGIEVVDMDGQVILVNKSFESILGVSASQRLGNSIFDVSPNGSLVECLRTKAPVHINIHPTLDGKKVVLANVSPIIVKGQMNGAVSVFRDVSDIEKMNRQLEKRNNDIKILRDQVHNFAAARYSLDSIIGQSNSIKLCINMARKIASSDVTVLITGESGTGKELFAHGIHNASRRANGPFVKINCAAIPENLLESEFFGYEAGAFTGAGNAKMGKFELANTGTLFLDEIGEMNHSLQAKLLRVLQDKEVVRLGSNKPRKFDVRIIAATNKNLLKEVTKENFRQDLYYRLNVVNIEIPPLRERLEDIPLIAQYIINKLNEEYSSNFVLSYKIINELKSQSWPGNIRELENYLGKRVLFDGNDWDNSFRDHSNESLKSGEAAENGLVTIEENEKHLIFSALEKYGYDLQGKQRAAKELKISLSTLYNKLKRYKR